MKKLLFIAIIAAITSCESSTENEDYVLETNNDSLSYIIGANVGKGIAQNYPELKKEAFNAAISDMLGVGESKIADSLAQATMNRYMMALQKEEEQKQLESKAANQEFLNQWLADTISSNEIVTTFSGLQYQILIEGNGPIPTATDKVETHYHGTLLDGTVFDSSVDRGESISFPVGGVIAGWTEALQLMPVGSKWKLIIPSELAYGERGAGQSIGPNTDLIFIVELLGIN
ncbi:MAG: FKBP-type peptidyl-prolyl cis-trans isomerase [Flavobacteriales bacterium]|nr:FKBP-type peptidyl-prolyl cis-trans isomerase [Flavobacteriales bacterium]